MNRIALAVVVALCACGGATPEEEPFSIVCERANTLCEADDARCLAAVTACWDAWEKARIR